MIPASVTTKLSESVGPFGGDVLRSCSGDTYNHPIAVRVNRGGEITEVTEDGTRLSAGSPAGRGVRIEVDFISENDGHLWTLALQFHKGQTFTEVYPGPALAVAEDPGIRTAKWPHDTIWRD